MSFENDDGWVDFIGKCEEFLSCCDIGVEIEVGGFEVY